jgi:hypothetical protein
LAKSARSEAEAHALRIISRSWLGLAGQIDRYNALVREASTKRKAASVKVPSPFATLTIDAKIQ